MDSILPVLIALMATLGLGALGLGLLVLSPPQTQKSLQGTPKADHPKREHGGTVGGETAWRMPG
jgi:hypothetical protein